MDSLLEAKLNRIKPSHPKSGEIYLNTNDNKVYGWYEDRWAVVENTLELNVDEHGFITYKNIKGENYER